MFRYFPAGRSAISAAPRSVPARSDEYSRSAAAEQKQRTVVSARVSPRRPTSKPSQQHSLVQVTGLRAAVGGAERSRVLVAEIQILGGERSGGTRLKSKIPERMGSYIGLLPVRGVAAGTCAIQVPIDAAVGRKEHGTGIVGDAGRKSDVSRIVVSAVGRVGPRGGRVTALRPAGVCGAGRRAGRRGAG